jgi:hypothetical protein
MAVTFPPLIAKAKTTRGFPRVARTSPAALSMRASRAACTRPENAPATSRVPLVIGGASRIDPMHHLASVLRRVSSLAWAVPHIHPAGYQSG